MKFAAMFKTEKLRAPSPTKFAAGELPRSTAKILAAAFDDALLRRLLALPPPSRSLAWLSAAVDVLPPTLADAQSLVAALPLPFPNPLDVYLAHTAALLDLCNSVSAEIERLRHRRLLLRYSLHLLATDPARAIDALHEAAAAGHGGARIAEAAAKIGDLAIAPPRSKSSPSDKLLRRAFYAVGFVAASVAGAAVAVLAGTGGNPFSAAAAAPGDFAWAEPANALRSGIVAAAAAVGGVADEVSAVDVAAVSVRDPSAAAKLAAAVELYSDGLDRLGDSVNRFFRSVLGTRNSVLQNYRPGGQTWQCL